MPAQLRLIKSDEPRATYRADALWLRVSFLVCAAAAAVFTALGYRARLAPVVAGPCAAAFALWSASLAVACVERSAQRFTLTSRRLEIESGIVSRRVEHVELWRVREVRFVQGLLERVHGAGRVALVTGNASMTVGPVVNARPLYDALLEARLSQRGAATASAEPVRDRR
jgi:membrane protein YdbS with pleckstrin-like domain